MPQGPGGPEVKKQRQNGAVCFQRHPTEAPCALPDGVVGCGHGTAGAGGAGVWCGVSSYGVH